MDKIRVLVADSEVLFREGVRALLKIYKDIEVVGVVTSGEEAIEMAKEKAPDVLLMDIDMPIICSAEVTHRIRMENSDIKVLLFSQHEDKEHILTGLKAGANGFLPKRATASDLISAILTVHRGNYFLYPSMATIMVSDYLQHISHPESPDPYDQLTYREREVLRLIVEGHNGPEIASLLGISVNKVMDHKASIKKKLNVHNQTELIKYALRKHLISLNA